MPNSIGSKDKKRQGRVQLRRMIKEDLPRVLDFFELVNPLATREQVEKWTTPMLSKRPQLCWVAVIGEQVVGAITADLRHDVPFIEDLFVQENHRRQGIGGLLITRVLEEFRRMKVIFVKVETNPSTWPLAQKFYYRHGFRVCGVEQDRFGMGPQGDSVVLKRLL